MAVATLPIPCTARAVTARRMWHGGASQRICRRSPWVGHGAGGAREQAARHEHAADSWNERAAASSGRTWEGVLPDGLHLRLLRRHVGGDPPHLGGDIRCFEIAFIRNAIGTLILVPFMMPGSASAASTPRRFRLFAVRAGHRRLRHVGLVFCAADHAARGSHHTQLHGLSLDDPGRHPDAGRAGGGAPLDRHRRGLRRRSDRAAAGGGDPFGRRPARDPPRRCFFAVSMALVRMLARTESPLAIVFYMNLIMTPLSLGPALWWWEMPTPGTARLAARHRLRADRWRTSRWRARSRSWRRRPWSRSTSRASPSRSMIGWFAFGEFPGIWTWVGAVFIVGSAPSTSPAAKHSSRDAAASGIEPAHEGAHEAVTGLRLLQGAAVCYVGARISARSWTWISAGKRRSSPAARRGSARRRCARSRPPAPGSAS